MSHTDSTTVGISPILIDYWRAADSGDEQASTLLAQILDDLAPHLSSMAGKAARQLHSPLAEFDDLVSAMQVKVLQTLRRMPRTVASPSGYLVNAARHGLMDYLRLVVPHLRCAVSLDELRPGCSGDGYTLADLLPDVSAPARDACLSRPLADVLAQLRPCEQAAIADAYQFDDWTPRAGQRPAPPRRDNLYRAHAHLRALCSTK